MVGPSQNNVNVQPFATSRAATASSNVVGVNASRKIPAKSKGIASDEDEFKPNIKRKRRRLVLSSSSDEKLGKFTICHTNIG